MYVEKISDWHMNSKVIKYKKGKIGKYITKDNFEKTRNNLLWVKEDIKNQKERK